jgi:hypothetical protein
MLRNPGRNAVVARSATAQWHEESMIFNISRLCDDRVPPTAALSVCYSTDAAFLRATQHSLASLLHPSLSATDPAPCYRIFLLAESSQAASVLQTLMKWLLDSGQPAQQLIEFHAVHHPHLRPRDSEGESCQLPRMIRSARAINVVAYRENEEIRTVQRLLRLTKHPQFRRPAGGRPKHHPHLAAAIFAALRPHPRLVLG